MYRSSGFTIFDALLSLLIVGLISMIAAPSFKHLLMVHQSHKVQSQIIQALSFARANALTAQETTTLCPATNSIMCGNEWKNGILVFNDINASGAIDHEAEKVLFSVPPAAHEYSLKWAAFGNRPYLRYTPLGHTQNQNGTFIYCPITKDAIYANTIIINRTGRIRKGQDKNRNGIIERANGEDVTC